MQSTKIATRAATMFRAQQQAASSVLRQRATPMLRMQMQQPVRTMRLQATPKMRMPMPKEEHSAHTISQRIRTLKKIPPELIPLGVVLAIAIFAAGYSMIRKFYTDSTLRLHRRGSDH